MIFSLTMFAPDTSLKSFQKQQINVGLAGVLPSRAQNPRWVSFCFYFCILISVWQSPEMSIHMQREVSFPFPTPKIMRCHLFTANRHERLPQWSCVRAGALTPLSAQHKHTETKPTQAQQCQPLIDARPAPSSCHQPNEENSYKCCFPRALLSQTRQRSVLFYYL